VTRDATVRNTLIGQFSFGTGAGQRRALPLFRTRGCATSTLEMHQAAPAMRPAVTPTSVALPKRNSIGVGRTSSHTMGRSPWEEAREPAWEEAREP
jgi:hypothetical protein